MAEELPDAPWATKELPDAPWATAPEPSQVPESFLHRVAAGYMTGLHKVEEFGVPRVGKILEGGAEQFIEGLSQTVGAEKPEPLPPWLEQLSGAQPENQARNERAWQAIKGAGDVLGGTFKMGLSPVGLATGPLEEATGGPQGNFPAEATENAIGLIGPAIAGLPAKFFRMRNGAQQVIGTLPKDADFANGSAAISPNVRLTDEERTIVEQNLRDTWQERGIHPAEAVHDAQNDAFLKQQLATPNLERDASGIVHPQGSPVPAGTPRTQLAKTGDPIVDNVLDHPVLQKVINNPVIDDTHEVPNSWGGSTPFNNPITYRDKDFPKTLTVDGVTFDTAEPATIHENIEEYVLKNLMELGWDRESALRVAYWGWGNPAEHAWYRAHGMDPEHVEAVLKPYLDAIASRKAHADNIPPDLFKETYPNGDPLEDVAGEIEKPSAEEMAQAKAVMAQEQGRNGPVDQAHLLDGEGTGLAQALGLREPGGGGRPALAGGFETGRGETQGAAPVGAAVTPPGSMPSLTQQPPRPAGSLVANAKQAADRLFDMARDLQMKTAPMATGSKGAMALAKDFANAVRRNRWEWGRIDSDIAKRFTPEQRKRMWDAADEESVLRQEGQTSEHMGFATLEPEERAAVEDLQSRAQIAWAHARDMGMVDGEGLPSYTPRMIVNAANAVSGDKAIPLNGLGANLRTRTAQMMHRKYLTAEETEAAAKAKLGEEAEIARDIRALPLSTAHLEDAVVGRKLIDSIKEYGRQTGGETVADGWRPDSSWFTIDHPSFRTFRPRFEQVDNVTRAMRDQDGQIIFDQVPIYIRGDFEGPLRAVLSPRKGAQGYSGAAYGNLMALKGKTMGLIMNSPLIHNAVEWGRALPAMPGKVASFKVYFEGNRAKNDIGTMREAINSGLVPIGKRFFNQDITSIMEEPNLTPGRSWTAQVLGAVPGLFDEGAGNAVKAAIDKAGDFWHNTLLWDRIADLQMGLYTNFRDSLVAKGVDGQTATRAAAHWANRYAGALPKEAMSDAATKVSNFLMFSRTFTMGNLGVMKDMLAGMPRDVLAQIERDAGFTAGGLTAEKAEAVKAGAAKAVQFSKTMARRKAIAVVALDAGLFYVGNSVLQSALNVMKGDHTLDEEMHGYAQRLSQALQERKEHPLKLLQPFDFLQSLSSTSENEPGKADRVKIGHSSDGTAIYIRNPVGKIGEEFVDYLSGNELDMIRRKLGTIARPAWQILANDKGFGRKVYDPDADVPEKYLRNVGNIVTHIAGSQLPEGQIGAFSDLVTGQGDAAVNAAQAFLPIFPGVTASKGAPGGEAVGELYHAREEHQYAVDSELPDIRRQLQRGDERGARDRMTQLGIPRGLQNFYVRTSQNPALRLSPKALRDFYRYATPEEKQRMENVR